MIILVPVSRFRVSYEVASGRPFSQFERLVLQGIQQGTCALGELHEAFQIHPRLLIEALVTLTHAGWVAVGAQKDGGFVLTREGREAASSVRPPATTVVSTRRAFVVMERITGGLLSNEDVRFFARKDLERVWAHAVKLRADVAYNRLDEGQVQHLLPRKKGEWVRWIGPIDMVSKDSHWIPVNVDLPNGLIVGLPDALLNRLRPTIIDKATDVADALPSEARRRTLEVHPTGARGTSPRSDDENDLFPSPVSSWPVLLDKGSFRFTTGEHDALLIDAFRCAQSCVLAASASIGVERLETLRPHIEDALKRGVDVDFLWGVGVEADLAGRDSVEWMRRVAFAAKREGWRGVLRFNRVQSVVGANVLLWDPESRARACVGSFQWLRPSDDSGRHASVSIIESAAVAAIARCVAGFWSAVDSEVLSSASDRWRRIASNLDMEASSSAPAVEGNATAQLVLDREHEAVCRELLQKATSRALVASQELGPPSQSMLAAVGLHVSPNPQCVVLYRQINPPGTWQEEVVNTIQALGGSVRELPDLRASVVIGDTVACISSYRFLSAELSRTDKPVRDLGVVIDGAAPSEWLWRGLRHDAGAD